MSDGISEKELAALFMETGKHHHAAYKASDGVDPEWALFYAVTCRLVSGTGSADCPLEAS